MTIIDFYYSIGSRYSYLASTQIKEETTNQLNKTIDRALESGVFGVPTFIVSGELFWGNDRIVLLRHHLQTITESTKDY